MVTIGVDQLLSTSALYEYRFLENIKKLYKSADKWDYQQHYKVIIEADMVSTPERLNDNIPLAVGTPVTMKNQSARNSLSQILALLNVKQKTAVCRMETAKKSASKSRQADIYGLVFINRDYIQRSMQV